MKVVHTFFGAAWGLRGGCLSVIRLQYFTWQDWRAILTGRIWHGLSDEENYDSKITHGTQLILTQLETGKLRPFQWEKTRNHIKSIYRNFLRDDHPFYSKYKIESNIEIIAFGEKLSYEEPGFLKSQWHKDRHNLVSLENSPEIEWKYEFDKIF